MKQGLTGEEINRLVADKVLADYFEEFVRISLMEAKWLYTLDPQKRNQRAVNASR